MMEKSGTWRCDACGKKIHGIHYQYFDKDFCDRCFNTAVVVEHEIAKAKHYRTIVKVKDIVSFYDTEQEIPY